MKFGDCTFIDNLDFDKKTNLHNDDYYKLSINKFTNMRNF